MGAIRKLKRKTEPHSIRLTDEQLREREAKIIDDTINEYANRFMSAALWALHTDENLRFGDTRLRYFINATLNFINTMAVMHMRPVEVYKQLQEETGFDTMKVCKEFTDANAKDYKEWYFQENGERI